MRLQLTADLDQPVRGDHAARTHATSSRQSAGETGQGRGKPDRADEAKWRDALGDAGGQSPAVHPVAVPDHPGDRRRDSAARSSQDGAAVVTDGRGGRVTARVSPAANSPEGAANSAPVPEPGNASSLEPSATGGSRDTVSAPDAQTAVFANHPAAETDAVEKGALSKAGAATPRPGSNADRDAMAWPDTKPVGGGQDSGNPSTLKDITRRSAPSGTGSPKEPAAPLSSPPIAKAGSLVADGADAGGADRNRSLPVDGQPMDWSPHQSADILAKGQTTHPTPHQSGRSNGATEGPLRQAAPLQTTVETDSTMATAAFPEPTPLSIPGAAGDNLAAMDAEAGEGTGNVAATTDASRPVPRAGSIESLFQLRAMDQPGLPAEKSRMAQGQTSAALPPTGQSAPLADGSADPALTVAVSVATVAAPRIGGEGDPLTPPTDAPETSGQPEPAPRMPGIIIPGHAPFTMSEALGPGDQTVVPPLPGDQPQTGPGQGPPPPLALAGSTPMPFPVSVESTPGSAEIARQIMRAMPVDPGQQVAIVLSPEELGTVRMVMQAKGDHVTLLIHADRSDTMDLMRRATDDLMQELRSSGFASVSLEFGQNRRQPPPQQVPVAQPYVASQSPSVLPDTPAPVRRLAAGGLDLRL